MSKQHFQDKALRASRVCGKKGIQMLIWYMEFIFMSTEEYCVLVLSNTLDPKLKATLINTNNNGCHSLKLENCSATDIFSDKW